MFNIIKLVKLTYNYTKVFGRSLSFFWATAPREILFITAALLLQGISPAFSVWIIKQTVDVITAKLTQGITLNSKAFASLIITWIGVQLLASLLEPWVTAIRGNLNEKLTANFNLQLMRKSSSFADLNPFENSLFYDELQLIQRQASEQPMWLLGALIEGLREFFTIITMLGLLVSLGWWIPLLILIAALPQTYISLRLQGKNWEMAARKSPQARLMHYYSSLTLSDTHAKEVRLFNMSSFLIDRYIEAFKEMHRGMRHVRNKQARWSTSLSLVGIFSNGFVFYWVVQQAFNGVLSPGNVFLFVQALSYIRQTLPLLIIDFTQLYDVLLYMQRFFKFLDSKPTMIVFCPGESVPMPISEGITFDKISFFYPDGRRALTDISFTLHPGETIALVGENGAGKTTLVKLLTRLYDPTAGNIRVDGKNLRDLDLKKWREQIAVVFQDFGRYAFTVEENIALTNIKLLFNHEGLIRAANQVGVAKTIDKLPERYKTCLGKQFAGTELSGGQWQKLALARAFFREKAQILILDEPTAALDPRSEYELYRRFAKLRKSKISLLITHRLASVRMADRILVLKDGCLVENGTHEELLKRGDEYASLWKMQSEHYNLNSKIKE